MDHIIADAVDFVRETFRSDFSGHDASHTMRVYKTALRIAENEHADQTVVALAALLHDVDDIKLSPKTHREKARAVSFMQAHGLPAETVKTVCGIIEEVSFAGMDSVTPETIEGKCVQDADRLDAIGAVGIGRAFAYGGSHGRAMYDPAVAPTPDMDAKAYRQHKSTTINHFYEKLFLLKDMLNTKTAKAIAEQRDAFMHAFLEEFLREWEGLS
ncbi:MAG: HD domain-containing protein [Clostridia bacterium]|nr:HD domain-containing protein [Clostridia bacterium]